MSDFAEVEAGTNPLDNVPAVTGVVGSVEDGAGGTIGTMCSTGNAVLVGAGSTSVRLFNIFSQMSPSIIANFRTVRAVTGGVACGELLPNTVAVGHGSLGLYDIADPLRPRLLHDVRLGRDVTAVAIFQDVAVAGLSNGQLVFVDMTQGDVLAEQETTLLLGEQAASCHTTCGAQGLQCLPYFETNDAWDIFTKVGIHCTKTTNNGNWWAQDQPCYVSSSSDPNFDMCLGFRNVPASVDCAGFHPAVRRLCACTPKSNTVTNYQVDSTKIVDMCVQGSYLLVLSSTALTKLRLDGVTVVRIARLSFSGGLGLFCGRDIVLVTGFRGFSIFTSEGDALTKTGVPPSVNQQFFSGRVAMADDATAVFAAGNINSERGVQVYDVADRFDANGFVTQYSIPGVTYAAAVSSGLAYVSSTVRLYVVNFLPYDRNTQAPSCSLSANGGATSVREGQRVVVRASTADDVLVTTVDFAETASPSTVRDVAYPFEFGFTARMTPAKLINITARVC